MSYHVPNVCYVCCGTDRLESVVLQKPDVASGANGPRKIYIPQEAMRCEACSKTSGVVSRVGHVLNAPFYLVGFLIVVIVLAEMFQQFGAIVPFLRPCTETVSGWLSFLPTDSVERLIVLTVPAFLMILTAMCFEPIKELLKGLFLVLFYRKQPLPGFKWIKYSQAPHDLVKNCPLFVSPDYQAHYDRLNPRAASSRQGMEPLVTGLSSCLNVCLLVGFVAFAWWLYSSPPPPKVEFGPATRGKKIKGPDGSKRLLGPRARKLLATPRPNISASPSVSASPSPAPSSVEGVEESP